MRSLINFALLCPKNDAESELICRLAEAFGVHLFVSPQGLGARLETEPDTRPLLGKMQEGHREELWIVEIPGPQTEAWFTTNGITVLPIDHHTYGPSLDRSRDAEGNELPSSLHQFLAHLEVTDDDLRTHNFDPRLVYGIGLFDHGHVMALRRAGYDQSEIQRVLAFRGDLLAAAIPNFTEVRAAAEVAWARRVTKEAGFTVVFSGAADLDVRGEVMILAIDAGIEESVFVIGVKDGEEIFVQNPSPALLSSLNHRFSRGQGTFTFGGGRCWGVNNLRRNAADRVALKDVTDLVKVAIN